MSKRFILLAGAAVAASIAIVSIVWLSIQALQPSAVPQPAPSPATSTPVVTEPYQTEVIGQSVEGRDIVVYQFGTGPNDLLFVGGIHGGYEWNSALLAWEMIDQFTATPDVIPENVTVHIIPALNPDGLAVVTGTGGRFTHADVPRPAERVAAGRFNANGVDLNRNFACNWTPESTWRGQVVSAGTAPFSEPEAAAFRAYVSATEPEAVGFWHSQANTVYGSACNEGVLPATTYLGETYATAASYNYVDLFTAYPITGDVEGWLASIGIPALTIELESYQATEWTRNWAGVQAWLSYAAMAE